MSAKNTVAVTAPVRRRRHGDGPWVVALLALPMLGLGVFYVWPLIRTVMLSFSDGTSFRGYHLTGVHHWVTVLSGSDLPRALGNTLLYAAIVLLGVPIAMVVAVLLHQRGLRFRSTYRVFYFLPVVTMPVAIAMVWRYIYNGDFGLLNAVFGRIGLPTTAWIADPRTVLVAVAIVGIWMSLGTNLVILAAGMEAIPDEVMEAAMLDGA
ncbi:MAG: sugar ABC transporter permease, partial [Micrococcales bacterium]|nr:sugar ABC transporter permease [Micrococcales bacterium]